MFALIDTPNILFQAHHQENQKGGKNIFSLLNPTT